MRKSLATVIRLQRWQVDAERRRVTDAAAVVHRLDEAMAALTQRCEAEKDFARDAEETGSFAFGPFLRRTALLRTDLERQRGEAEGRLAEARQCLADAYREQRKFEVAEAEQRRRRLEARAKKEQEALDEIALNRFCRKEGPAGEDGDR